MVGRMLSITSDFNGGIGDPVPSLMLAAEAGMTHIHYCHHWDDMYVHTDAEIGYLQDNLRRLGLKCLDVHATDAQKQGMPWMSEFQYEHEYGLYLIERRINFARRLAGDEPTAIVLHAPPPPPNVYMHTKFWSIMDYNLKQLTRWAKQYQVRIAIEQTDTLPRNWPVVVEMLRRSDPEWIGFCLDTGHGNIHRNNREALTLLGGRLYALHLNDNRGPLPDPKADPDVHMLPLDGTVDWKEVVGLLRDSSYEGPLSFEVGQSQYRDRMSVNEYLRQAYQKFCKIDDMMRESA